MGLRRRFFLVSAFLIATSVVSADLYLGSALRDELAGRLNADLQVRLSLVEHQVGLSWDELGDLPAWDRLADELGQRSGTRVTLIATDGRVLGDSAVALADLPAVENHAARPEVRRALAGQTTFDSRASATVHRGLLYLATPLQRDGRVAGVARVSMPTDDIERAIARLHQVLAVSSLIALVVALLASTAATHLMTRPMRAITDGARRMAQGDLTARIGFSRGDELGDIGRALDQLAASLSATLDDLRAERDRLGRILEAMEEGVLVTQADGQVLLMNPALRAIPGVATNGDLARLTAEALANNTPTNGDIAVGTRRLLVHAAPLSGEPKACVAVLVDVTEIRRLESVRRDFVANVSHELRTPVTAVRTALETARPALRDDPDTAEQFLAMAERNADRLVALVRDLLDLSQLESGDMKLELQSIDVRQVAEGVLSLYQAPADRRKVRLVRAWGDNVPNVRADRRAVEQVLTNLIDNAVKYGAEGGAITVRAAGNGAQVQVQIEDTGNGIESEHLPRLFERFYRVDAGRSRDRGGTGLGLSIVKHLTEAMAGTVTVNSTLGRGSTFTVTLPVA